MRLALISDIHGNDVAFAAAMADVERVGVDEVVCLGDVAQGGPQPRETLRRLRALACPVVKGNSDDFLLEVPAASAEAITERHLELREWSLAQLERDDLAFIRSFEPTIELRLAFAKRLLAFHGSPRSNEDVLTPDSEPVAVEPFRGTDAAVLAGGHTHMQWTRRIDAALFVNPGSVGLAYDRHQPDEDFRLTPVAEYALVSAVEAEVAIEFRRVPYSLDELAAVTRASGRPHAEASIADWRPLPDAGARVT